ncbi:acetoin utilization protein AcuC [Jannaschia pagri]|uniref:Acetoin utilization protein AcuC n=1 Tax=Jannaschia pagri TaxID=2829797 RepID=A0ABQ4NP21_9RHOB|nr:MULTISPECIES: acetoin utilization protein AcuC [unclassified Jannaschia]GIT92319.1 acetoin utilization protein AcuC [Jannaschia sp. AI_61]GIT96154.1 acetoin utilization protein AcuC [Jannaschia sp. AI_62]
MTPLLLGSEIYRGSSYGKWHPLRVPRVSTVLDLVRVLGWLPPERFRISPRAKPAALSVWHTPEYLAALEEAEVTGAVDDTTRTRHGLGTVSNPVFPEMYRRPATGAGGSLLAGEILSGGGVVHNPGGGTHHGMPDRASGFCYLNDAVLGILSLRRNGAQRIAYVDIDAHHMDGVEYAFADDADTLLISTHEEKRWPFTGALDDQGIGQVFNLPLPRACNDSEFALARDRVIRPAVEAFAPDAIVLQCGADAVEEDPLSRMALSNTAHWAVLRALLPLAPRVLILGGGGYNPWTVGRLWAGNWAIASGQDIPDRLTPEAEAILRAIPFDGNSRGRNPPDHLFTTLRDTPRPGPIRQDVIDRVDRLAARLGAMPARAAG